jgi:hypothetical protein
LSLRVNASGLPSSNLLGGGLGSRGIGSSGRGGGGLRCRGGSSGSWSAALVHRRGLGKRNNGLGNTSADSGGPSHRLRRTGRLLRGSGRSSDRLGDRRRAGVLRLLGLLDILLGKLLSSLVSSLGRFLSLGLRDLSLIRRLISNAAVQSRTLLRSGLL